MYMATQVMLYKQEPGRGKAGMGSHQLPTGEQFNEFTQISSGPDVSAIPAKYLQRLEEQNPRVTIASCQIRKAEDSQRAFSNLRKSGLQNGYPTCPGPLT